jgi:hypothetical protein
VERHSQLAPGGSEVEVNTRFEDITENRFREAVHRPSSR